MTKPWIGLVLAIVALMVACYFFLPRGYGPVSNEAYQFAKALYGAALEHSEERMSIIEERLDKDLESLTPNEQRWLQAMVDDGRAGRWTRVTAAARQMMEDQITR